VPEGVIQWGTKRIVTENSRNTIVMGERHCRRPTETGDAESVSRSLYPVGYN